MRPLSTLTVLVLARAVGGSVIYLLMGAGAAMHRPRNFFNSSEKIRHPYATFLSVSLHLDAGLLHLLTALSEPLERVIPPAGVVLL